LGDAALLFFYGQVGYYQPIAERCTGAGSAVDDIFYLENIMVFCGKKMVNMV
jgi:hypothetical protein